MRVKTEIIRQSLAEQIKAILIDRIVDGELKSGDRIKELRIANEFGTSQAPVREAIQSLVALGYLEHVPHMGAMVKAYSKAEIEEAYQVREALELHSVGLITNTMHSVADQLGHHLANMEDAVKRDNIRLFIQADNHFHRSIVEFCDNETMLSIWDSLKMQLQVVASLVEASMPLNVIFELHPPIVQAFREGTIEQGTELLKGHYKVLSNYWEKTI